MMPTELREMLKQLGDVSQCGAIRSYYDIAMDNPEEVTDVELRETFKYNKRSTLVHNMLSMIEEVAFYLEKEELDKAEELIHSMAKDLLDTPLTSEMEDEDMDRKKMEMIMFMTRIFDSYCGSDEVNNEKMRDMEAQDRDDFIINFVEMAIEDKVDDWQTFLVDGIKESFPLEEEYELVEVEISRIRHVKETKTVYVAVKKGFGENSCEEAEYYIDNSYCDSGYGWEEDDDFYNSYDCEIEVGDVSVSDTGTKEELETYNDVHATLD